MPNLLAMSFEGELAPSFDLMCLAPGGRLPDGWGLAYYPAGEPCAQVLKEPAPPQGSIRGDLVRVWEHLASSLFVVHVRSARWGRNTDANTQPFVRSMGGRDFVIAHGGSLEHRMVLSEPRVFEPVGSTDTELVFCELLNRAFAQGQKSLAELGAEQLQRWLDELNDHGSLSLVITDGRDLFAYADKNGSGELFLLELLPPYERLALRDDDLALDLTRRGTVSRKGVVVASNPLVVEAGASYIERPFERLTPGELVVARQGSLRERVAPQRGTRPPSVRPRAITRVGMAEPKRISVVHRTVYRYQRPVERSVHALRLEPFDDRLQRVRSHILAISVGGQARNYVDVFGNRVHKLTLETPFTELSIEARSQVDVLDTDPLGFAAAHKRTTIPLVWMPWQHHMLQPFLLPPELPESQLQELASYAMSFVERNDYDLLDTLLDLNRSFFTEYVYSPGETNLFTTPFDVYARRRGVCQDFTNLFICLARLLGVPARYVCGYVFTGPQHANQRMGEASHAWVEVYLPEVGWRGFDPTNGSVAQTDHVRVAVGRSHVDATPTSGTIYVGGGGETLEIDVRVEATPLALIGVS